MPNTWNGNRGAGSFPGVFANGYGDDGNGDGKADINDLTDGAFGAAKYLAANGGKIGSPEGTPGQQPEKIPSIRNAIWHYNHADWYVERVFTAYKEFLAGGSSGGVTASSCNIALAISEDGFVFPLKISSKQVIINGSRNQSDLAKWCYGHTKNCHGGYNAADIHVPTDTIVVAARGGVVLSTTYSNSNGQNLRIKGEDGLWYYYVHMRKGSVRVGPGDVVTAGQELGLVGTSEDAQGTAPHLHFDVSQVDNGFTRNRSCAADGSCPEVKYLLDVQPVLLSAFKELPDR